MPIVEVPGLSALGLIPFQLNPHYLDPDPGSTHLGVRNQSAVLAGASAGRLFRRGVPPANVPAGTDLSFLLDVVPRFDVRTLG